MTHPSHFLLTHTFFSHPLPLISSLSYFVKVLLTPFPHLILIFFYFFFFSSSSGQAIVVGMGKKNPNAQKGRERRGKSKKQA
jgi:hypothetical protein